MILPLLLLMLLLSAIFIAFSSHLVFDVISLAAFSFLIASIYLVLGAPDVAITEASVGGAVSTIFILCSLFHTKEARISTSYHKLVPAIVATITFLSLLYVLEDLPVFAEIDAPVHRETVPFYIENTQSLIGIPNLVTAILASFRGYDTFGETTVVLIAGLAVSLILRRRAF